MALACAGMALTAAPARATGLRACAAPATLTPTQQDRLFRFAAVVKGELDRSGRRVALVARSGLALDRYGVRYSHAALSLREGLDTRWAVRQLYYACDEGRPRVFDEGLSGFLTGLNDPDGGHVSVVTLSGDAADRLERAALDRRQALALLGERYSANAYPFSRAYQNCNQWLAELLAAAWAAPSPAPQTRADAQAWLLAQGYQPTEFAVQFPPVRLLALLPWLHLDDHPTALLDAQRLQVSLPAAIDHFVRRQVPDAERLEFCLAAGRVVVHRGWQPLGEGCQPGPDDTVVALD